MYVRLSRSLGSDLVLGPWQKRRLFHDRCGMGTSTTSNPIALAQNASQMPNLTAREISWMPQLLALPSAAIRHLPMAVDDSWHPRVSSFDAGRGLRTLAVLPDDAELILS
jgi:hypothetical protein